MHFAGASRHACQNQLATRRPKRPARAHSGGTEKTTQSNTCANSVQYTRTPAPNTIQYNAHPARRPIAGPQPAKCARVRKYVCRKCSVLCLCLVLPLPLLPAVLVLAAPVRSLSQPPLPSPPRPSVPLQWYLSPIPGPWTRPNLLLQGPHFLLLLLQLLLLLLLLLRPGRPPFMLLLAHVGIPGNLE